MLIRRAPDIRSSEITDEQVYLRRREFMRLAGGAAVTGAVGALTGACGETSAAGAPLARRRRTVAARQHQAERGQRPTRPLNSFEDITSYNNFYEFGTGKNDPAALRRTAEDRRRGR